MTSGADHRDDHRKLATAFIDALRPVAARMTSERTLSSGKVNVLRHLATYGRATTAELSRVTSGCTTSSR